MRINSYDLRSLITRVVYNHKILIHDNTYVLNIVSILGKNV